MRECFDEFTQMTIWWCDRNFRTLAGNDRSKSWENMSKKNQNNLHAVVPIMTLDKETRDFQSINGRINNREIILSY
jgi:hypothetical protein